LNHDLASLKASLAGAPAKAVRAQLTRLVPFKDLIGYNPPNWLYTSGKPNRCNPAGVNCVYFSEGKDVAQAEYEYMWQSLVGKHQPVTTYFATVELHRVLDLADDTTLKALNMDAKDLFKNWRRANRLTLTQLLGQAVNETGLFSAIRFPSKASAMGGHAGINFVIFRSCVRSPDVVRILGPANKPLQEWP